MATALELKPGDTFRNFSDIFDEIPLGAVFACFQGQGFTAQYVYDPFLDRVDTAHSYVVRAGANWRGFRVEKDWPWAQ